MQVTPSRSGDVEPSMAPLAGRRALVTGAGRGIGAAIARALAADGAAVLLCGRSQPPLQALAETLGHGARALPLDVADVPAILDRLAAEETAHGPIDILVNNAGAGVSSPFHKMDQAHWEAMLAVNLTGVFACTRALLPGMTRRGWGRVVTVASTAGLKGYAYVSAYVAAKHGAIGLTRALALEVARSGVTVNAVCPGFADTEMTEETLATIQAKTGRDRDAALAELTRTNPQGRLVQPQEVANAVQWLCRPGSDSITGQAIAVAGGEVM